jgi:hypothetical protein
MGKLNNKIIFGFVILTIPAMIIAGIIIITQAQESLPAREDRLFEKNGISINLDSITYTDGRILSYDLINPPTSKVLIHNWDKLSVLSKTSITNTLTAQGYTDKGSFNPDPVREEQIDVLQH